MITPLGKLIRKLRIDKGVLLKDMAGFLAVSSSYLSALEQGKKNINDTLIAQIKIYFNANSECSKEIDAAAVLSQQSLKIDLTDRSDDERELAVAFARDFNKTSGNTKIDLEKLLKGLSK